MWQDEWPKNSGESHPCLPHEPQALPARHTGLNRHSLIIKIKIKDITKIKIMVMHNGFLLCYFFQLIFQTCHLTIASYGWTANDLIYLWKVPNIHHLPTIHQTFTNTYTCWTLQTFTKHFQHWRVHGGHIFPKLLNNMWLSSNDMTKIEWKLKECCQCGMTCSKKASS